MGREGEVKKKKRKRGIESFVGKQHVINFFDKGISLVRVVRISLHYKYGLMLAVPFRLINIITVNSHTQILILL